MHPRRTNYMAYMPIICNYMQLYAIIWHICKSDKSEIRTCPAIIWLICNYMAYMQLCGLYSIICYYMRLYARYTNFMQNCVISSHNIPQAYATWYNALLKYDETCCRNIPVDRSACCVNWVTERWCLASEHGVPRLFLWRRTVTFAATPWHSEEYLPLQWSHLKQTNAMDTVTLQGFVCLAES